MASENTVPLEKLYELPILMSRRTWSGSHSTDWKGLDHKKLDVVATFNLLYNATFMVEQGIGYALTMNKLIFESDSRNLTFRPITPTIYSDLYFVTKKYQAFSPAAKLFINELTQALPTF